MGDIIQYYIGELKNIVTPNIHVNSKHYGIVEDVHMILEHLICSCIFKVKNRG